MPRHSHQDAVTETTFDALLDAADGFAEPYRTECLYILYTAGRLGLRGGELCHLREDWIDWDRSIIEIPMHDSCTMGKDGGPCGYCKSQARQSVQKTGVDYEYALSRMWSPKTHAGSRAVPFGFDGDLEEFVEAFFFHRECYPRSRSSVNRRVDRVAEAVGMDTDDLYPHALRATAATYHAYRGLPAPALQSLMGWTNLDVAQKYVRLSGGQTQKALQQVHSES